MSDFVCLDSIIGRGSQLLIISRSDLGKGYRIGFKGRSG